MSKKKYMVDNLIDNTRRPSFTLSKRLKTNRPILWDLPLTPAGLPGEMPWNT